MSRRTFTINRAVLFCCLVVPFIWGYKYKDTPYKKAESLFDGKTTKGWQTFKNREVNSWDVQNGTLHCKPYHEGDKRGDLITEAKYGDFDLSIDWKISPLGNTGVIYRLTEEKEETYWTGPEYQIIDDKNYPGMKDSTWFTAGNFDLYAPAKDVVKPIGEWNTSRIVAKGNHIEHWLNGVKLLDYKFGSADWKERVAKSKYKDADKYGTVAKGHIALQDHGKEVWFKNITIKKL